jgi:hypothetical protein
VTSVKFLQPDPNVEGTHHVEWSKSRNGVDPVDPALEPKYADLVDAELQALLATLKDFPDMKDEEQIMIVEMSVPFEPFTKWVGIEAREWAFVTPIKPRYSQKIDFKVAGGV